MSEHSDSAPTIYYIPDNFIGESRILNGQIRVMYLVDSIILSLILGAIITLPLLVWVIKDWELPTKITVAIVSVSPGFIIGQIGYNEDRILVFLKNFFSWTKKKQVRIYNENTRLLGTDPVKAIANSSRFMDTAVGAWEEHQQRRIDKKNAEQYIEGETFEFQYDPNIDGFTDDVGDYDDQEISEDDGWPTAQVSIDSGSDLAGLWELVSSMEAQDTTTAPEGSESLLRAQTEDEEE